VNGGGVERKGGKHLSSLALWRTVEGRSAASLIRPRGSFCETTVSLLAIPAMLALPEEISGGRSGSEAGY